ncbi:hypothetical protein QM787_04090 [Rhodococcus ruber]|uniref:Uncharacterized protein n=1 Tax=Rhodococcus ruber TaxID=1830 RepID=A0A098BU91_9NOCA|nr:hypothetical protein [Rhodococcus ruber]MCD2127681.1 hypothetical protein [Rhodococcus ruber]MCZ4504338.1 hypothetical protein [Rhodococcus ruber]MCZ4529426.1 hypothetical protein [Rhodococcus ruber]MCZ4620999.1 hypothetical protein [Rhodococcus ruber]MDI9967023.1 hypothetical protein [Rhodococcus ruber]
MGTMRTFDPDGWTPRELVSPDGRRFTPSTRAEEGELLARRYRVASPEQDQDAGGEPVAPAPRDISPASEPVAAPAPADEATQPAPAAPGESIVDDVPDPAQVPAAAPVDAAETAPPKPRRARAATQPTPTTEESQA